MKVIAVDFDFVMNDMLNVWIDTLNSQCGTSVGIDDIESWEMQKSFPTLNKEQIFSCLDKDEFWLKVNARNDCAKYFQKLQKDGFIVKVVTATHYLSYKPKVVNCLLRLYPFLHYRDIIICYDKYLVKCDYIIDDYDGNLKMCTATRLLFDAPYNQNADKSDYEYRVHNWEEIYNIVKQQERIGDE